MGQAAGTKGAQDQHQHQPSTAIPTAVPARRQQVAHRGVLTSDPPIPRSKQNKSQTGLATLPQAVAAFSAQTTIFPQPREAEAEAEGEQQQQLIAQKCSQLRFGPGSADVESQQRFAPIRSLVVCLTGHNAEDDTTGRCTVSPADCPQKCQTVCPARDIYN